MSKFISTGFGEALDDMWLWFKFSAPVVKVAYVIFSVFPLGLLGLFILSFFTEPFIGFLILGAGALIFSVGVLSGYEDKSAHEKREERAHRAHRKAHPRPVLHDRCDRCYDDKDARGPRRYLSGRMEEEY